MRKFLDQLFGRGSKQRQNAVRRRNLLAGVERMEARCVLDASPWCNMPMPADVNGDGAVSSLDASAVGTTIANNGGSTVSVVQGTSPSNGGAPDATNDWLVNQADVDFVNNAIAQASGSGSGSSSGTASGTGSSSGTSSGSGSFTIGDATVTEGGDLRFPVTFHGNATAPSVTIKTMSYGAAGHNAGPAGGYAGDGTGGGMLDYDAKTETMIFTGVNGETHDFIVHTHNDTVTEWTEFLTARITAVASSNGANLSIGSPSDGKGIIEDNDTAVISVVALTAAQWEGDNLSAPNSVVVSVNFSGSIEMPGLTVDYSTSDGTAHAGTDYQSTSGTYALPWGVQTGINIPVLFVSDRTVETLLEDFDVSIANIGGGGGNGASSDVSIGTASATVNIKDEDTATIMVSGLTPSFDATEGSNLQGQIIFVGTSDVGGGTVDLSTTAGTAKADDGTGGDYVSPAGLTLHVDSTATRATPFTISVKEDQTVESASEWFDVLIDNLHLDDPGVSGRITIGTASAVATIHDNDAATVSVSDASQNEDGTFGNTGSLNITFRFTLSKPVDVPVTITFVLASNGDANFVFGGTPGQDINELVGVNRTVTIAAGDRTAEWSATTVPDTAPEDSESFVLDIVSWFPSASRDITGGDLIGIGWVVDNWD